MNSWQLIKLHYKFPEVWYLEDRLIKPSPKGNSKRQAFTSATFSEEMIVF